MEYENDDKYEGLWENDTCLDTKGVYNFKNGSKFVGNIEKNLFEG